jgi:hypothetical protein
MDYVTVPDEIAHLAAKIFIQFSGSKKTLIACIACPWPVESISPESYPSVPFLCRLPAAGQSDPKRHRERNIWAAKIRLRDLVILVRTSHASESQAGRTIFVIGSTQTPEICID